MAGRIAAGILLGAAAILAVVGGGGDGDAGLESGARLVDVAELREAESTLGHPLYWVGPRAGRDPELEIEGGGNSYLRYVPSGKAGGTVDPAEYLTVGTYPLPEAQAALRRSARAAGVSLKRVAGGGLLLADPAVERSAYLVYPDSDLQIEVYDPAPGQAAKLIESGAVRPVGAA